MSHRAACVLLMLISLGCRDEQPTVPPPPVTPPPAPTASRAPSPALTPEQVVRLVTEAMGHNDTPGPDAGIATAFAFASPGNRATTGPLTRFAPMVKSPAYRPLLEYARIEYGPVRVERDHAEQIVTVTADDGETAAFLWVLSRQRAGEFEGCWMTDAVTRLGAEPPPPDPNQRQPEAAPEIRV